MADNSLPMVVILAGGLATRLKPRTEKLPKALVRVAEAPFLVHILKLLRHKGVEDILLCVGHLGEQIVEAVGDGEAFGVAVRYSFDGPRLLGTGGALKNAEELLPDEFFLLNGDTYVDCDYAEVYRSFRSSGKEGLMTVYHNQIRREVSNVAFRDGAIQTYDKVNPSDNMEHLDCGLGMFRRAALTRLPAGEKCDLSLLYQSLLDDGELAAFELSEPYFEIGTPAGLKATEAFLGKISTSGIREEGVGAVG